MNKYFLLILFVVAVFLLLTLSFLAKSQPYFPIDLRVTLFIQKFNLNTLMLSVSWFGYGWFKYAVLTMVASFLLLKKFLKEALILIFSSLGAELLSGILKFIVSRPRPDPNLIKQVANLATNDSFPSGHVLYYIGFFGFILFLVTFMIRNRYLKSAIAALCLFFLILIGPSRIYLGEHWLSDVLGAYLAGLLWLSLSIFIYNRWEKNEK